MPIHRRAFLGALAVAPTALAGCATGAAAGVGPSARPAPAGAAPADPSTAAVRAFPLPADAEPALVFRAGAARPGEP